MESSESGTHPNFSPEFRTYESLLTVAEAARRLRRCEKTIRRYCNEGRIGHHREETGRILIPEICIDEYLNQCFVEPSAFVHEAEVVEITSRSKVRSQCPEVRSVVEYDNRIFTLDDQDEAGA